MNYTKEQLEAVSLDQKDIIVSAGAGAGKTRVLVDRIARLLRDRSKPLMAGELLVLTFTNAAAAEMKERIITNLNEAYNEEPENRMLAKQIRMIKNADISTVHSFCSKLLRMYYHEIGLDPSYRIGEEGELTLLRRMVMEELLEDRYESGDPDFFDFVEAFVPDKTDGKLETIIEKTYNFSNNFPDKNSWFEERIKEAESYCAKDSFSQSAVCCVVYGKLGEQLDYLRHLLTEALDMIGGDPRVVRYETQLRADLAAVEEAIGAPDLLSRSQIICSYDPGTTIRERKEEKSFEAFDEIKAVHGLVKKRIDEELRPLCIVNPSALYAENTVNKNRLKVLFSLAGEFGDRYFQKKKERNIYDFNDLEHLTLKLLISGYDEKGEPVLTEVAKGLRRKYKAIFVDEYQDTNLVQETIITTLHEEGLNHLFVVGDVKQSIYRFRQARPDLFLKRYDQYRSDEKEHQIKIELKDNFRSCPEVLQYTNYIFRHFMTKDFGGIDYSTEVALSAGVGGPMEQVTVPQELRLFVEGEDDALEINALEAECLMIADRIHGLREEGYEYGDMAILLRSAAGYTATITEILAAQGIPVLCDSRTGYFSTREISIAMNYLTIVDNVYQDIPMASVLLSPIGGITPAELAEMTVQISQAGRKDVKLYDALLLYLEQGQKEALKQKVKAFLTLLEEFRLKKKEYPLHTLLWEIYQKTGLFRTVLLEENADEKKQNLLMLIEKARDYEKTVFKGLFNFVRYMQQLKSYEIDLSGTFEDTGENAVKIMTIHKSKGLEFPVVFLSRLQGRFNMNDLGGSVLYHPEYGVGIDYIDTVERIAHSSFQKKAIKEQLKKETLEEELRILYVGMTRAQKKLILTGYYKEKELISKCTEYADYFNPMEAKCFSEWILAAMMRHPVYADHLIRTLSLDCKTPEADPKLAESAMDFAGVKLMRLHELGERDVEKEHKEKETWETFTSYVEEHVSERARETIRKSFTYQYPYEAIVNRKRKYSVSELKTMALMALQLEQPDYDSPDPEFEKEPEEIRPRFLSEREEEELSGAARGTIYHKVMELLSFGEIGTKKDLFEELDRVRKIYPASRQLPVKQLYRRVEECLFSPMGEQLRALDREGKIHKEYPFTIGLRADQVEALGAAGGEQDEDDFIVVQGVIDLYADLGDRLWLFDFKTDRIEEGNEAELLDRYKNQMLYYSMALEQMTGKNVEKIYLYSFALKCFVPVDLSDGNR